MTMTNTSARLTASDLIDFEQEIADIYAKGTIRAPIHLRSGCEEQLIEIFSKIRPQDYIYSYWASHLHCLLKGVPREQVKQAIEQGRSIALCFPEHRIFCSGIVGSLAGVATGTALGIKMQHTGKTADSDAPRVYLFTGDMGSECGIWFESLKYATGFDLPIEFVVEDNGVSVMTETRKIWGSEDPWFKGTRYEEKVKYFKYKNTWPHSGLGKRIAF